jgi:hypothetical protein
MWASSRLDSGSPEQQPNRDQPDRHPGDLPHDKSGSVARPDSGERIAHGSRNRYGRIGE